MTLALSLRRTGTDDNWSYEGFENDAGSIVGATVMLHLPIIVTDHDDSWLLNPGKVFDE